jgi:hypothetical protein
MRLAAATLALSALACGRDKGVSDDQLVGLVKEATPPAPIDVTQATKDPAELDRAMASPYDAVVKALGPHAWTIETRTLVEEGGKPVEDLSDKAVLELGEQGAFHGVYTNSADYGREAIFVPPASLFLRPRYQKWHGRAPETAVEPAQIRDGYAGAIAATWELLAPGAELTDKGAVQVGTRAARKIAVKLAPTPRENPSEPLSQRRWRESRSVTALEGEITLDADTGVPLGATLTGAIAFSREGRRFTMKLGMSASLKPGATPITAPPEGEVVATPTRRGEVDERDYLLHGIAPPIRKNKDGTAVKPATPPVKP